MQFQVRIVHVHNEHKIQILDSGQKPNFECQWANKDWLRAPLKNNIRKSMCSEIWLKNQSFEKHITTTVNIEKQLKTIGTKLENPGGKQTRFTTMGSIIIPWETYALVAWNYESHINLNIRLMRRFNNYSEQCWEIRVSQPTGEGMFYSKGRFSHFGAQSKLEHISCFQTLCLGMWLKKSSPCRIRSVSLKGQTEADGSRRKQTEADIPDDAEFGPHRFCHGDQFLIYQLCLLTGPIYQLLATCIPYFYSSFYEWCECTLGTWMQKLFLQTITVATNSFHGFASEDHATDSPVASTMAQWLEALRDAA